LAKSRKWFERALPSRDAMNISLILKLGLKWQILMYSIFLFDESWKVGAEGDVGAYWGIWDKDENLKFMEGR
jgi:exo-beta-1,3-glucanase (GH17 family)